MRSGVITQKVGMTRVYSEAGEQIPVTVLRLDNCQVVAQRTAEKNGYTALQLGSQGLNLRGQPGLRLAFSPHQLAGKFGQAGALALFPDQQFMTKFHFPALEFTPDMAVAEL